MEDIHSINDVFPRPYQRSEEHHRLSHSLKTVFSYCMKTLMHSKSAGADFCCSVLEQKDIIPNLCSIFSFPSIVCLWFPSFPVAASTPLLFECSLENMVFLRWLNFMQTEDQLCVNFSWFTDDLCANEDNSLIGQYLLVLSRSAAR